tara:strand:+ start:421 stop:693 length:273 start_codon:yes stop_codon:yes gene_type:complete
LSKEKLDEDFQNAAERASNTKTVLPPDIQLLLYAYYKKGNHKSKLIPVENLKENDLRSAFKYNALIQIKGLTATEAKKEYIKLVAQYIVD